MVHLHLTLHRNPQQRKRLAGNTDAVASIQQVYKDMTAAYKEAVEGVTAE